MRTMLQCKLLHIGKAAKSNVSGTTVFVGVQPKQELQSPGKTTKGINEYLVNPCAFVFAFFVLRSKRDREGEREGGRE